MKSIFRNCTQFGLTVALLSFFTSTAWLQQIGEVPADPQEYVSGELLIKFVDGAPQSAALNAAKSVRAQELNTFQTIGVRHWRLSGGISVQQALDILARQPFLQYAEPNYIVHAHSTPNDPRFGEMWGLHNIGQSAGLIDADIDALEAWDIQTGSSNVVVGGIDTGIDYLHEDLSANIWVNSGEIGFDESGIDKAVNGIDDDNNGFIDDVRGWDFYNDDNDPMDDHGHGTHTAGTIGAVGNNAVGVTGVNWTVTLMPLKFLSSSGSGTTAGAIAAVLYAASFEDEFGNKIVRITNNSWGGGRRSKALKDAIASSGALFVASAGNNGNSRKNYPAGYDIDNIISVAATDNNDELASFSSYGSGWVDLGAPGVKILSTIPNNGYDGSFSGTSMAAPHVAGAVSLLLANEPGLSNDLLKTRILATVDALPSLDGKTVTGGRLNAFSALNGGSPPPPPTDTTPPDAVSDLAVVGSATTFNSITLNWTATGDDGNEGTAFLYDIRYLVDTPINESNWGSAVQAEAEPVPQASGSAETFTVTGLFAETLYYLALKVADEAGNFSALSKVVFDATLTPPGGAWAAETVDSEGKVGFYHSLAYAPDGNPSIGYSDESRDDVKFAHWNGATWDIEVVDPGRNVATGIALAYDPLDDNPSLSYGSGKLKFAHWNGASWDIEVIESARNDVTSLVYDPGGNPSISYRTTKGKESGLKFARFNGVSWNIELVELNAGARYSSLAYDPAGNPSIAYSDDIDGDNWLETLKFARWNGSSWEIEIVQTGVVGFGVFASLAYDPITGNPSIAHRESGVRFASWNGSSWELEVFEGKYASGTSLVYNSAGKPLIGFEVDEMVKVARRTAPSTWEVEIVDAVNSGRTSLKLDPAGNPSISYLDWGNRDIKFARKLPSASEPLAAAQSPSQRVSKKSKSAFFMEDYYNISDPVRAQESGTLLSDLMGETTASISTVQLPDKFSLSQNYPNPFNPETTISYDLPVASDVKIVIYNLMGQEVRRWDIQGQPAGNHRVRWDASSFASGVYLYRLQAGDFVQTRKMVLLK